MQSSLGVTLAYLSVPYRTIAYELTSATMQVCLQFEKHFLLSALT